MRLELGDEVYEFEGDDLTNKEAIAIEKATGLTHTKWSELIKDGSMTAFTALVWTLQKREDPTVGFDDVDFTMGEVSVEVDDDEARTSLKAMKPEDRAKYLQNLPVEQRERLADEAPAEPVPTSAPASD